MLFYTSPASDWSAALPVGNGRLGAMVYGRTDTELLQLNEDSVWYGGPQQRTPQDAHHNLRRLRDLIRRGLHQEAEDLVRLAFFAYPSSQRHYEPLGKLTLDFDHQPEHVINYRRELDLSDATTRVEYEHKGERYRREVIASYPDQVIALRIECSKSTAFVARLNRTSELEYETNEFLDKLTAKNNQMIMHATPGGKGSIHACCVVAAHTSDPQGSIKVIGNSLQITAREAVLVLGAQTTFRVPDPEATALSNVASALQNKRLWHRHIDDYKSLYDSSALVLLPNASHIPTNERLRSMPDPGLVALYHNYGKYLLISCSRHGSTALPATLQGIWNPSFHPAWGSKYTININLQMNYWHANICNISECELPFFDLLERVAEKGVVTARTMYGCRGWCAHHNTDIWADTDPQDRWMPSTLWPLGGAWLCTHIWESFQFSGNVPFLKRMFPILKGCIQFILDFLIDDASGKYLVTNPSLSPENTYVDAQGNKGILCEGSAIDIQIITYLFESYLRTLIVLERPSTEVLASDVKSALSRLPPFKTGKHGQLLEWPQDYTELEPGHRHTSHLWALYPGNAITAMSTPDLAQAADVTLRRRAAHGGGHTGWSRAWLINLHARLGQADTCLDHLTKLLANSTLPNLLDDHPPFQIDGNFGGTSGIAEMILQSHEEERGENESAVENGDHNSGNTIRIIRLLPACPLAWKQGSAKGYKARGGFEIDFDWDDSETRIKCQVHVRSLLGNHASLVFPNGGKLEIPAGSPGEYQFAPPASTGRL